MKKTLGCRGIPRLARTPARSCWPVGGHNFGHSVSRGVGQGVVPQNKALTRVIVPLSSRFEYARARLMSVENRNFIAIQSDSRCAWVRPPWDGTLAPLNAKRRDDVYHHPVSGNRCKSSLVRFLGPDGMRRTLPCSQWHLRSPAQNMSVRQ